MARINRKLRNTLNKVDFYPITSFESTIAISYALSLSSIFELLCTDLIKLNHFSVKYVLYFQLTKQSSKQKFILLRISVQCFFIPLDTFFD